MPSVEEVARQIDALDQVSSRSQRSIELGHAARSSASTVIGSRASSADAGLRDRLRRPREIVG